MAKSNNDRIKYERMAQTPATSDNSPNVGYDSSTGRWVVSTDEHVQNLPAEKDSR